VRRNSYAPTEKGDKGTYLGRGLVAFQLADVEVLNEVLDRQRCSLEILKQFQSSTREQCAEQGERCTFGSHSRERKRTGEGGCPAGLQGIRFT
jgi:hypothetical protein